MSVARKASTDDVEQIIQLSLAVQKIHSDQYPDLFKEVVKLDELSNFYIGLIGDKDQYIFVSEIGDEITGYCWAEVIRQTESPITHGISKLYIHQICVNKRYRGKGVGAMLVREIKTLAKCLDVNHVGADSWSFNSRAVDFFRSQDFKPRNERMWLK